MGTEAVTKALKDAKITYDKIDQAAVGYVYGE
jgi:3-oxoacyl-[acyl-carrier-protein] synthase III